MYHTPCFNLFILHNNSCDNQGSEINKNVLRFDILSFTQTFLYIYAYKLLVPAMCNGTSCAQVQELQQNHCGDNREDTLYIYR